MHIKKKRYKCGFEIDEKYYFIKVCPLSLIIFDFDGTLSDSAATIIDCMQSAFTENGVFPPPSAAAVRAIIGLTLAEAISRLAPEKDPTVIQKIAGSYEQNFRDKRHKGELQDGLFPEVRETIISLKNRDHVLAIATGKSLRGLKAELERHALTEYFSSLQCADFHPSKPHPSMLLTALSETGKAPEDAIMIGDTSYDMVAGRGAGVRPYGVSWGCHSPEMLQQAGAESVLNAMSDIHHIIRPAEKL